MNSYFFEVVLSSFLGFGSALLVEAIVDSYRNSSTKKQLLVNLKQELSTLQSNISSMEENKVYIRPYSIPIWSGARECGSLICMDKSKCFPKLLEVFSSIEEANLVEMKCFEVYVGQHPSKEDMDLIVAAVSDSRRLIKKQIENGLTVIEEELK